MLIAAPRGFSRTIPGRRLDPGTASRYTCGERNGRTWIELFGAQAWSGGVADVLIATRTAQQEMRRNVDLRVQDLLHEARRADRLRSPVR